MKPGPIGFASGTCSTALFYICNCEDTANFKQVTLYTEIRQVTMFIIQHVVKSLEAWPFPPSSPK